MLDFNAIFANQDPLPTLRPGNFDLHTKMPGIRPFLSRSIQMSSVSIYFSSAGGVNASAGVLFEYKPPYAWGGGLTSIDPLVSIHIIYRMFQIYWN